MRQHTTLKLDQGNVTFIITQHQLNMNDISFSGHPLSGNGSGLFDFANGQINLNLELITPSLNRGLPILLIFWRHQSPNRTAKPTPFATTHS